jgi:hypothetical protein
MARKDLAGIAALAGLGMLMANRGKKGSKADEGTRKRQMASDKEANADAQSMEDDSGMDAEEAANKRTERTLRNPNAREFGEAGTSMTVSPSRTGGGGGGGGGGGAAAAVKPAAPTAPALKPMSERYQPPAARPNPNFGNEGRRGPVGQTYASAADQIPGQSSKAPQGGERVDSSEAERNINAALTVAGVGGAGATAYKAKKMYDASQKAKAAAEAAGKGREAVTNPLMWMAGPKNAGKFAGEVPAAGRESVTNPMSWMAGPKNADKFKEAAPSAMDKAKAAAEKFADRFRKKPLDEADTTGGAIGYKRGGKVRGYASGGSVSSASSRGDGIATKGKTRGKIC